jgi:hypothetical protein
MFPQKYEGGPGDKNNHLHQQAAHPGDNPLFHAVYLFPQRFVRGFESFDTGANVTVRLPT